MNIFLNEYFGFWFELNFELNHFSAQFNEKMNFQNIPHTPTAECRYYTFPFLLHTLFGFVCFVGFLALDGAWAGLICHYLQGVGIGGGVEGGWGGGKKALWLALPGLVTRQDGEGGGGDGVVAIASQEFSSFCIYPC